MRLLSQSTLVLAAAALAVATPAIAQRQQATRSNDAINIPFEKYALPNGLNVILAPDSTTPRVVVDVWYHVGSKNETPGRTGFAHMFEHVMFTGSGNVPYGLHDRLTNGVGGSNNGSTNFDRTNYYQTVPSNYLETVLWLEADRMGFLLDKLDSAKFAAQRDIVQNERRQRTDNPPYGRQWELQWFGMYPTSNPYSWPVVGYMSDLQAASVDDVKEFFRLYYAPSNATLAVVGDFEPARTKAWIAKYFADLPKGKEIRRPSASPPLLTTEKRLVFEDRVQVPRLYVRWPVVGARHADNAALQVLSAILIGPRTARLTKALVYDNQSAAGVVSTPWPRELLGEWGFNITPRPGVSLTTLEAMADSVIDRLKHQGPTAEEVQRATAGLEFSFVSSLQDNLSKAETLLDGQVFYGDPAHYKREYAALKAVTPNDIKRVANTYLGAGRVVLSIVPQGKPELAAKPEASTKVTVTPDGARYVMENK